MGVTPCDVALQGVFNASTDFVAAQWSGEGAGVLWPQIKIMCLRYFQARHLGPLGVKSLKSTDFLGLTRYLKLDRYSVL